MAFAAAIGPIIGAISSIGGAFISAGAQNQQANQQQEIANYNAARDREQAAIAQSKGAVDSYQKTREGEINSARGRAAEAEGGAQTTDGSPLLLQQKFASETQWRSNLAMADATNSQRNLENKASVEEYQGQVQANASRTQAGASLLSGFAGGIKSIGGAAAGGAFG